MVFDRRLSIKFRLDTNVLINRTVFGTLGLYLLVFEGPEIPPEGAELLDKVPVPRDFLS